jgi:predicted N-acyltransferase
LKLRILNSLDEVDAQQWNALDLARNPCVRHEFLATLEREHCATARTGWKPQHVTVFDEAGTLLGAVPLYLKTHSWGEFVFDWSWANAYARAGLDYYPKLVSAVPFTPAAGPRLLAPYGRTEIKSVLLRGIEELARDLDVSSTHVLFNSADDQEVLSRNRYLARVDCQFHWENRGFHTFEDFLRTFRADKRKKAHRERRRITEAGIHFQTLQGGDISPELWKVIYAFSANTFARHGHEHYLSMNFFIALSRAMPEAVMVKLALRGREPVAAAIFFVGGDTLYGRYWGAAEELNSLHFEACYYQGIDYCIEHGLQRFEPGTQGEHKVPRGFAPKITCSAHWIAEPRFRRAIAEYLERERAAIGDYASQVQDHVPFRRDQEPLEVPDNFGITRGVSL